MKRARRDPRAPQGSRRIDYVRWRAFVWACWSRMDPKTRPVWL